jgi:hypothetical protein
VGPAGGTHRFAAIILFFQIILLLILAERNTVADVRATIVLVLWKYTGAVAK